MRPKDEVALIAGAVAAIAQVVIGAVSGNLDITGITAAVTAVMAIFVRQNVTPVSKIKNANSEVMGQ